MNISDPDSPARFRWLPPGARPRITLPRRQEIVFLLVGTTIIFSGYDLSVFGLALPQIQSELHIPEDMAGLTVSFFRLATIPAFLLALLADRFGRRRLLLITVFGEAALTLATALCQNYEQFVWFQIVARVFGYCEELLCFVVIAEEIDARVRGWSTGLLGALNAAGAGVASLLFAVVNYLPYGWRSLYVIGGGALMILAYYRRMLPETQRFEQRQKELAAATPSDEVTVRGLRGLLHDYPGRLITLVCATGALGFASAPSYVLMSKYLQQTLRYAPAQVTALFIGGGLVAVAGNTLAGRVSDRIGRKRMLFIAAAMCGGAFAIFFSGVGGWQAPAVWVLAVFGYFVSDALMHGYPSEIFPTEYRATTSALQYLMSYLGGAVGLALEGVFYDRFGSHGAATSATILAMPVALLAILFLPETAQKTLEQLSAENSQ